MFEKESIVYWLMGLLASLFIIYGQTVSSKISYHIDKPYHETAGAIIEVNKANMNNVVKRLDRIENKVDKILEDIKKENK